MPLCVSRLYLRLTFIRRSYRTSTSICFIRVLHTALTLKQPNLSYLGMESNSRSVTDMDDQPEVIHLKEISVDFIKKRPTSDLELVFKDDAGATRKSDKFKNGARVHWDVNIYLKTYTSATLTIPRLGGLFNKRVAEVSVEFKPCKFGDDKVVCLEDSNHRVTVTFVYRKAKSPADVTRVLGSQATFTNTIAPMNTQQPRRRIPEVQFRVLIIGRANAGKTSILKRICETTESPAIYRGGAEVTLDPSVDRGEHRIDDELVFSNHRGYVFHDSRGIESGSAGELDMLREFIRQKCGKRRLRDRLHAICDHSSISNISRTSVLNGMSL
ncbi:hypothetical protein EDB85DRAFT_639157 [Lactarius pseudohatsudake]|nr:hypothetical protein EDB85DRAFT_639157 [Lactarius pseudohatsudake]